MPPTIRASGSLVAAALAAAAGGFHVFPVWPLSKVPAVEDWEHAATRDPARIRAWWRERPWNIGVATGPSDLLVIDLDLSHSQPAPPRWAGARGGRDVLARLAAAAGEPMPSRTYTVTTASGGEHLYFRQPVGLRLRNTQGEHGSGLGWRIDTRGHGGFVVAAGSRRTDGHYRVTGRWPVAELPGWIAAALTPPAPSGPAPRPAPGSARTRTVAPGRVAAYVAAAVDGEIVAVATAAVGTRHTRLLTAARRLGNWVGGGLLDENEARDLLTAAAQHYIGVDGYTPNKIAATITDGLAYGRRLPRTADSIPDRSVPARD